LENRLSVQEDKYTSEKVKLPPASEIPNVDLQVINFHRPVFGTFHSKFTVVDRKIALLQSSNIQDNDNLEMLSHIEGPMVDGFYDAALLSWGKSVDPPLPLLNTPAETLQIPCYESKETESLPEDASQGLPQHTTENEHYDTSYEKEARRVSSSIIPRGDETSTHAVTRHLSMFPTAACMFNPLTCHQTRLFNTIQLVMRQTQTKTPR
jgi:phosphatidylserine/phosphatidylglycerophosphate/cardiolipin synthase-like enzyme